MKYFLALFLICTSTAMAHADSKGVNLGTVEAWSAWFPVGEAVNINQICEDVCSSYNTINEPRGYSGTLEINTPVRSAVRQTSAGGLETRFYCWVRVKKLTQE